MARLVNRCSLITDLVTLLDRQRGAASYEQIGRELLYLAGVEPKLVQDLLAHLLDQDRRFAFRPQGLELLPDPDEARALGETTFVVVDVETTGARPSYDRLTEVAAYKIAGGQIISEFSTLVNPERPISPYVVRLTGITDEMVAGAPRFPEVCAAVLDFFGDAVFVAHNAPFDWHLINGEVERVAGRGLPNARLCTVQAARRLLPGLVNYRLHTVADHLAVDITGRHRAAGDARATAQIFLRFLALWEQHGVFDLAGARRFRVARKPAPPRTSV